MPLTLQQNVFLEIDFSGDKFFVTKNLHLATKFIIIAKNEKIITFSVKISISSLKMKT